MVGAACRADREVRLPRSAAAGVGDGLEGSIPSSIRCRSGRTPLRVPKTASSAEWCLTEGRRSVQWKSGSASATNRDGMQAGVPGYRDRLVIP